MTDRLYYEDSFLLEFDAAVTGVVERDGRKAVILDRSAFYPTSGGQLFDIGVIEAGSSRLSVVEVAEDESGSVVHYIDTEPQGELEGQKIRGAVDPDRRRDHMQQHSGQHILSAAFEKLYSMPTVSFHMGDESCTVDLATASLSNEQVRAAERDSNRIVMEDRTVEIRSASVEQARSMGVRKIPDHVEGELRLIGIEGYDLNACSGTHVKHTGQVGSILLRKFEKVKQGYRIEFVCGERAIATARRDFETLTSAAALYATHIWEVPELIRKSQEELKTAAKERKKLNEEIATLLAKDIVSTIAQNDWARSGLSNPLEPEEGLAGVPSGSFKVIARVFDDRDINFIKLLAQKITATTPSVVLVGATLGQPGLVFAQTPGLPNDMGALMKEALAMLDGRGGGNRDLAQGGAAEAGRINSAIAAIAEKIHL